MNERSQLPRRALIRAAAGAGLALAASANSASADEPKPKPTPPPTPKTEDVASLDAIIAALYDVISGDKGVERDWNRFKSLFAPDARLIPCLPKNKAGRVAARVLTPDQFAELAASSTKSRGFHESEISRKTDRFGHIAQVFSTYQSAETKGGAPFARGINSFQFLFDESRWWVVTIFWDAESPDQAIPAQYLEKK